ncbi:MAG: uracil phosphoribosyltransferase [Candidatus Gottesmanbacteria bacterium]
MVNNTEIESTINNHPNFLELEHQPTQENALPYVKILTDMYDTFSQDDIDMMEVITANFFREDTDPHTFIDGVGYLSYNLVRAVLNPKIRPTTITTPSGDNIIGKTFHADCALFIIEPEGWVMGLNFARVLQRGIPIGKLSITKNKETLETQIRNFNLPRNINGCNIVILTPTNGAGSNIICAWNEIKKEYIENDHQQIGNVCIATIFSSPYGVMRVNNTLKKDISHVTQCTAFLGDHATRQKETIYPAGYVYPLIGNVNERLYGVESKKQRFDNAQKIEEELGRYYVDFIANDRRVFSTQKDGNGQLISHRYQ